MKVSKFICLLLLVLFIGISIYFISINNMVYAFISICMFSITGLAFIKILKITYLPDKVYKKQVNKIIKTYDSVLVEVENLPKLADKKIIKATTFKDIINAQYELRKPIYYMKEEHFCDFILLNQKSAYVYTFKESDDYSSSLEKHLIEKEASEKLASRELELIDELDKTTVIKLDNMKEFVVSPVRKKKKRKSLKNESEELHDYEFFVGFEDSLQESNDKID